MTNDMISLFITELLLDYEPRPDLLSGRKVLHTSSASVHQCKCRKFSIKSLSCTRAPMFFPSFYAPQRPYAFEEEEEDPQPSPYAAHPAHHPALSFFGKQPPRSAGRPHPFNSSRASPGFAPSARTPSRSSQKGPLFYWDPDVQRLIPVEPEVPAPPAKVRSSEFTKDLLLSSAQRP